MSIMNEVKSGADLTHPKPSIGYVVGAIVAMAVLGVAYYLFKKGKNAVTKSGAVSSMSTGLEAQSAKQLEGFL